MVKAGVGGGAGVGEGGRGGVGGRVKGVELSYFP